MKHTNLLLIFLFGLITVQAQPSHPLNEGEVKQLATFQEKGARIEQAVIESRKSIDVAVKALQAARTPELVLAAAYQLKDALRIADEDVKAQQKINSEIKDWIATIRLRVKCPDCELNVETKALVKAQKPPPAPLAATEH